MSEGVASFYQTVSRCRASGSPNLRKVLSLGVTPLADRLLAFEDLSKPEILVPLTLMFCPESGLVQIAETVDPTVLFFDEYPYFSSVSPSLVQHFRESAENIIEERSLSADHLVLEIASNDGYMLRNFLERDIAVLGIDPAKAPADKAIAEGIPTICQFFTSELAAQLTEQGIAADVVLANNVLAHVPDLNGFIEGMKTLVKEDGIIVIEAPYVVDLVNNCQFDTIYHQHLCYFSVTALDRVFRSHGLFLNRIERTKVHGGSMRLFVEKVDSRSNSVRDLLDWEQSEGVDTLEYYSSFERRVNDIRTRLLDLVGQLRTQNKSIVGYGAAAKACTLMNCCGLTGKHLDYIVDLNPFKVGRYMGGNHLPIFAPAKIYEDPPDFILILAWNFAAEIVSQLQEYRSNGGRFIIPIPEPTII